MTCPSCGAWGPGDASTGYDADDVCRRCADEGYYLGAQGQLIGPDDEDVEVVTIAIEVPASRPKQRMARAELWPRRRRAAGGAS